MARSSGTAGDIVAGDLILRRLSPAQAGRLVAGDFTGIRPGAGWPHEDSLDGLAMVAEGSAAGWLITLDGAVVGECGTHGPPDRAGVAEIGYGLAAPYRGRGYGRQMVRALAGWLLRQPGVTGLVAHTGRHNVASRRALESAGFRLDGEQRGECRYFLARVD